MNASGVLNGWPTSVPIRKVRMGFWSLWGLVFIRVRNCVCVIEKQIEKRGRLTNEILFMCVCVSVCVCVCVCVWMPEFLQTHACVLWLLLWARKLWSLSNGSLPFYSAKRGKINGERVNNLKTSVYKGQVWSEPAQSVRKMKWHIKYLLQTHLKLSLMLSYHYGFFQIFRLMWWRVNTRRDRHG